MRKLLVVLCLAGCGPNLQTVSDGCYLFASTLCDKSQQCGTLTTTAGTCRSAFVASCCSGIDCSVKVNAQALQFINDCNAAFGQMTCGQLEAGLQPTACTAK